MRSAIRGGTLGISVAPSHTHLPENNDPPLETEIPSIKKIIIDSQARVDALNCRIDAIRATMDALVDERHKLVVHVQRYSAVLAPIRRVFPELIYEIFAWASKCSRRIGPNIVNQPPWWLGHICRSWRAIALGDSSLWRFFDVFHTWNYPHQDAYPQIMIETQLLRSATAPLAIDLKWHSGDTLGPSPMLDFLFLHSNRWESLHVSCHSAVTSTTLLDILRVLKGQFVHL